MSISFIPEASHSWNLLLPNRHSAPRDSPLSSLSHGHLMLFSPRLLLVFPIPNVLLSLPCMTRSPYIQIPHIIQAASVASAIPMDLAFLWASLEQIVWPSCLSLPRILLVLKHKVPQSRSPLSAEQTQPVGHHKRGAWQAVKGRWWLVEALWPHGLCCNYLALLL